MTEATDFARVLEILSQHNVDFIAIGGFAAMAYSPALASYDLDILIAPNRENSQRLARALAELRPRRREFPRDAPDHLDAEAIHNAEILTLQTTAGDLDVLKVLKGVGTYRDALETANAWQLYGHDIRVLSLDHLIAAKRAANRPKDLLVLPALEALRETYDVAGRPTKADSDRERPS